ncbi:MAG: hypothetical protein JWQ19_3790 [Subtercola sp.]|nr:hypothetical protein [Subtercola sp.]
MPAAIGLRWGIKQSFLDYLSGLPDGQAALGDNVTAVGDNELLFDPAEATASLDGIVKFTGEVRFGGHRGLLFVRVAEPWLHIDGGCGRLTVLDPTLTDETSRIPLVTFLVDPGEAISGSFAGTHVRLTEEGVEIFNNVYSVGEPFEPFTVTA